MPENKFVFKNNGDEINNDVVYPGLSFDLTTNSYKFLLYPKTKFWRFGIRLSKTETIEFYHPAYRYKEPEFKQYIDIHLGVGEWDSMIWSIPDRVHLGQYNLANYDHILNYSEPYTPLGEIEWAIKYLTEINALYVSYKAEGCEIFSEIYELNNEYKFFKVVAWADKINFEIDCTIIPESNQSQEFTPGGNIRFRLGDIFDNPVLSECDLVVLPVSTNGSAQPSILKSAERFALNIPQPQKSGSLQLFPLIGSRKPSFWAWAYSVQANKGSSKKILSTICEKLIEEINGKNIYRIGMPLLGTGAGNMDPVDVARLYYDFFYENALKQKIVVSISNNEVFEKVETFFKTSDKYEYEKLFSGTQINYKYKNEIEPVLGVKDIADELVRVIEKIPTDQATMVGIFGRWGRGKTFLIEQMWKTLEKQGGFCRIDFHAWKYQDTTAVWAYLYEQFADKYYKSINKVSDEWYWKIFYAPRRIVRRLWLNYNRLGSNRLLWFLTSFSVSAFITFGFTFSEKFDFVRRVVAFLSIGTVLSIFIVYYRFGKTAKSLFNEYFKVTSFTKYLGLQAEVQKELIALIRSWKKYLKADRIILFVDDIDRCQEPTIIKIIDALRVMVEDPEISEKVIVISAIDENILKRAINFKYKELDFKDSGEPSDLTREYIDKLFLVGIKLGELSQQERSDFFTELTRMDRDNSEIENTIKDSEEDAISEDDTLDIADIRKKNEATPIEVKKNNDFTATRIQNANLNGKISNAEFKILNSYLNLCNDITPRQIKIFYYRYLLTKNLLIIQYSKNGKINIWLSPVFCNLLVDLLLKYSHSEDLKLLLKHKTEVLVTLSPTMKVYLADDTVSTSDYQELLKVLEIVIAY